MMDDLDELEDVDLVNDLTFGEYGDLDEFDFDQVAASSSSFEPLPPNPPSHAFAAISKSFSNSVTSASMSVQQHRRVADPWLVDNDGDVLSSSFTQLLMDDSEILNSSSLSQQESRLDLSRNDGGLLLSADQFLNPQTKSKDIWSNGEVASTEHELCSILGIEKGWKNVDLSSPRPTSFMANAGQTPLSKSNGRPEGVQHLASGVSDKHAAERYAKAKFVIDSYKTQLFDRRHLAALETAQRQKRQLRKGTSGRSYDQKMNRDPFAGLMTGREKQQLIRIQLMQLYTATPEEDDYYYQQYTKKKYPENSDVTNATALPSFEQRPQQSPKKFEGSLGKVSYLTVHRPRPLIDTEPISSKRISAENGRHLFLCSLLAAERLFQMIFTMFTDDLLEVGRNQQRFIVSLRKYWSLLTESSKGFRILLQYRQMLSKESVIQMLEKSMQCSEPVVMLTISLDDIFSRMDQIDLIHLFNDIESCVDNTPDGEIKLTRHMDFNATAITFAAVKRWNDLALTDPSLICHPNWMQFQSVIQRLNEALQSLSASTTTALDNQPLTHRLPSNDQSSLTPIAASNQQSFSGSPPPPSADSGGEVQAPPLHEHKSALLRSILS